MCHDYMMGVAYMRRIRPYMGRVYAYMCIYEAYTPAFGACICIYVHICGVYARTWGVYMHICAYMRRIRPYMWHMCIYVQSLPETLSPKSYSKRQCRCASSSRSTSDLASSCPTAQHSSLTSKKSRLSSKWRRTRTRNRLSPPVGSSAGNA